MVLNNSGLFKRYFWKKFKFQQVETVSLSFFIINYDIFISFMFSLDLSYVPGDIRSNHKVL